MNGRETRVYRVGIEAARGHADRLLTMRHVLETRVYDLGSSPDTLCERTSEKGRSDSSRCSRGAHLFEPSPCATVFPEETRDAKNAKNTDSSDRVTCVPSRPIPFLKNSETPGTIGTSLSLSRRVSLRPR